MIMDLIITLSSIILSSVFLNVLVIHDPKRRRAHQLPALPNNQNHQRLWWSFILLPGLLLIIVQWYAAFILWLAGISIIGWVIALLPPTGSKFKKPSV